MYANPIAPYGSPPATAQVDQSPAQQTSAKLSSLSLPAVPAKPKNKPRKRVNTAEKRHQHNAIERQRRETLNGKFIVLARLLPALATHRRPSKSAIVNGSIAHLTKQREQRLLASRLLRQLCAERDALAKECNEWRRSASGLPLSNAKQTSAWSDEMEEVCAVEKEQFGTWANMQDDDGDMGDDGDGDVDGSDGFEMGLEQATTALAGFDHTSLMAPRMPGDLGLSLGLGLPAVQPMRTPSIPLGWPSAFDALPTTASAAPISIPTMEPHAMHGLSSSTASLPFSAFMSDSLESMSSSPSGSLHGSHGIPTPSGSHVDMSRFTHTPSPRSSGSFSHDDTAQPGSLPKHQATLAPHQQQQHQQWTQQQLLFLHTMQQRQLHQAQAAEVQAQAHRNGLSGAPLPSPTAFAPGLGAVPGSFVPPTAYPSSLYPAAGVNGALSVHTLLQQQSHPLTSPVSAGPAGQGLGMQMGNGGRTLSTEQLEQWRKIATGVGADMSMSMGRSMGAWGQVQG